MMFLVDIFRNISNKKRQCKSDVLSKKTLNSKKEDGHCLAGNTTSESGDGKFSELKTQNRNVSDTSNQIEVLRIDIGEKEYEVADVKDLSVKSSSKNDPVIVENSVQHQPVTDSRFSQNSSAKDMNRNDSERIIEEIGKNSGFHDRSAYDGSTNGSECLKEKKLDREPMDLDDNEICEKELKTPRPILELTKRYDIMFMPTDVAKSRFEKENTNSLVILEEDDLQLVAVERRTEELDSISLQLKEGLELSKQKDDEICGLKSENERLSSNLLKISNELLFRFNERTELMNRQIELTREKDELKNKLLNVMHNQLEGTNELKITHEQRNDLVERITKIEKDLQLKLAENSQRAINMYQYTDSRHIYLEKNEGCLENIANNSESQKDIEQIIELKENKNIVNRNINALVEKYKLGNQTSSKDLLAEKSNYDETQKCLRNLEEENKHLKTNIERLENDISVLKKQLEDMRSQNESLENESRSQKIEASKSENKAKMLEVKLDEASCEYKQQKEQIMTYSTRIDELQKELNKKENENSELIKENCELNERANKISDLETARNKSLLINEEKLMVEMEKMYDLKIKLFYAHLDDISEKLSCAEKNLQDTVLKLKKYDKLSIEHKRLTLDYNELNQTVNELRENVLKLRYENNILNESIADYKNKIAAYLKPCSPNAGSQVVSCPNVRIRQTFCREKLLQYTCGSDNCTCVVELPKIGTKCDCAANLLEKDLQIKELTQKLDHKHLFIDETLYDLQEERNRNENMKLKCKKKIDYYKIKKKYWEKYISDMYRDLTKTRSQVEALNNSVKIKDEEIEYYQNELGKLKNKNLERNVTPLKMKQNKGKKSNCTPESNTNKTETTVGNNDLPSALMTSTGRAVQPVLFGGRLTAGADALPVLALDRFKGHFPVPGTRSRPKRGQKRDKRMPAPNAYSPGPTLKFPSAPKFTIAGLIPDRSDILCYTAADRVSVWDD